MVTPKNLIQNLKTNLRWDTRDADYILWHNAVKDYCAQHSIRSWASASQNEKDALIIAACSLTGFRSFMRNRLAGGSESHKKALEALLQDCLKKRSETSKNLAIKRAQKRAHSHENSDKEDDISDGGKAAGIAVAFWVYDPKIGGHRNINEWIWDEWDRRRLGVIQTMTLDGIWDIDLNPPNLSFSANYTGLRSDVKVKTFFRISKSDPVRLMVLLHSVPSRANTPPRADPYFELKKFIPRNEYEDFAEDSNANVYNVARVRRRWMPTKDYTFEQRKYELRGRVACQQETLNNIKK
ncbi:hypothetical protein BGX38DRAFT_1272835 [Terfezia claveryi]|nr:hypothetical protein BGX38DRAFT_1272835 [Terfezia claveryi]